MSAPASSRRSNAAKTCFAAASTFVLLAGSPALNSFDETATSEDNMMSSALTGNHDGETRKDRMMKLANKYSEMQNNDSEVIMKTPKKIGEPEIEYSEVQFNQDREREQEFKLSPAERKAKTLEKYRTGDWQKSATFTPRFGSHYAPAAGKNSFYSSPIYLEPKRQSSTASLPKSSFGPGFWNHYATRKNASAMVWNKKPNQAATWTPIVRDVTKEGNYRSFNVSARPEVIGKASIVPKLQNKEFESLGGVRKNLSSFLKSLSADKGEEFSDASKATKDKQTGEPNYPSWFRGSKNLLEG